MENGKHKSSVYELTEHIKKKKKAGAVRAFSPVENDLRFQLGSHPTAGCGAIGDGLPHGFSWLRMIRQPAPAPSVHSGP